MSHTWFLGKTKVPPQETTNINGTLKWQTGYISQHSRMRTLRGSAVYTASVKGEGIHCRPEKEEAVLQKSLAGIPRKVSEVRFLSIVPLPL